MAASDPSPYVATPTGTLQGVAAFSWDGSAWQPAGRAGPDVATATGVLQGVAPFAWDGAAWQPSGRAQPGVATPTGVLDGVAVYTWSGAAWTPASGTATPSTPSGALRGLAAFSWDGAAWQPAAQARASVPTPYGVLDGVAFFNWGGSTWQAGAAVPAGATLDLSFMTGTLDPRITFTRASAAMYFDSSGVMRTAGTNGARFDYDPVTHALRGLLIEEARTNMEANSASLATWSLLQTTLVGAAGIAPDGTNSMRKLAEDASNNFHTAIFQYTIVGATTYAFSVFAKAAENQFLVLGLDNGAAAAMYADFDLVAGTFLTQAVGGAVISSVSMQPVGNGIYRCVLTGATNSNTIGRAALTLAKVNNAGGFPSYQGVAGNGVLVWGVQFEAGPFPTSYIPTTGAAATRSADIASMSNPPGFSTTSGTYQGEFIPNGTAAGLPIVISGNAGSPTIAAGADSRMTAGIRSGAAVFSATGPLYTFGAVNKAAFAYLSGASTAAVNGTAFGPSATALTVTGTSVEFGSDGVTPGNNALNGYMRRVRYWPRVLSNAELQSVTT